MTEERAAAVCRELLGVRAAAVGPIADSASWLQRVTLENGQRVVVKIHSARPGRAELERRALTCLAAHSDVQAPMVLACGNVPGSDAEALVLVDVGPSNLGQLYCAGRCSREEVLEAVGSLLARIHKLPLDCGPGDPHKSRPCVPVEALIARCPDGVKQIAAAVVEQATKAITQTRPTTWCHGDLHPANVVPMGQALDSASLHVVDLEQVACTIPEYDVAQSLVTSDALDLSGRAAVLHGYATRLDHELLTSLIAYQALRGWAYGAAVEGRDIALWTHRLTLAFQPFQ